MRSKPTLLVLAAGIGSRYGGLKQMDPVGPSGEVVIDYSVYDALRAGFGKLVFVIRKDIEQAFREILGTKFEKLAQVEYVFQELGKLPQGFAVPADRQKPWGTGHAILMAKDIIKEPFAVINADDFYGADSYSKLAGYLSSISPASTDFTMVGFKLANTLSEYGKVARGICQTDKRGELTDVEELTNIVVDQSGGAVNINPDGSQRKLTGNEIVSMNMWGFTPKLFDHLESKFKTFLLSSGSDPKAEYFIPTVVNELIKAGDASVKVLETASAWFGVTYREDKPRVIESIKELIGKRIYPSQIYKS
jgi:UTP-glucose-1-phosphate uridylyltransferase